MYLYRRLDNKTSIMERCVNEQKSMRKLAFIKHT